uniref:glucuronosyltransferase n=1 Tax=Toxocara canis TaxID=6265 RepID=A0A183U255_TOXCA
LMRRLRNEKFDLGISEAFSSCGFGIFEKIRLHKYLIASNTELMEALTEPFGISYNPAMSQGLSVHCFVLHYSSFSSSVGAEPHSKETMARCPSVFVNTNILLDFPREVNSKVVFVGGITASQSSSLSEDFKRLMDVSSGGVVLVSFGTIALSSRMPPSLKYVFVSVFRRFPEFQITFIWKYELDDEVASDLPNVVKRKWVPQSGLLGKCELVDFLCVH